MPRRPGLDTTVVVQKAADILNAEGPQALTLNRLANELGIQPPSLYNHVGGLPGLYHELALLNARNLAEWMGNAAMGKSGATAVTAVAESYRTYIKTCPGLYLYTLRASQFDNPPEEAALQAAETRVLQVVFAAMSSFELAHEDLLHAVRGLRSLVHGFTTLEVAGGFGLSLDCDESFRRLLNTFTLGLSQPPYKSG